jgi:hypothetical protein
VPDSISMVHQSSSNVHNLLMKIGYSSIGDSGFNLLVSCG